jgi:hypothetical protein
MSSIALYLFAPAHSSLLSDIPAVALVVVLPNIILRINVLSSSPVVRDARRIEADDDNGARARMSVECIFMVSVFVSFCTFRENLCRRSLTCKKKTKKQELKNPNWSFLCNGIQDWLLECLEQSWTIQRGTSAERRNHCKGEPSEWARWCHAMYVPRSNQGTTSKNRFSLDILWAK